MITGTREALPGQVGRSSNDVTGGGQRGRIGDEFADPEIGEIGVFMRITRWTR